VDAPASSIMGPFRKPAVNPRGRQCGMVYSDDIEFSPFAAEPAKWSMRRTIAFVVATNLTLWIGFIWAITKLIALI
jgi:hypothetical protein